MRGEASASWSDGLTAVWPERFTITNLGKLRLNYSIGAPPSGGSGSGYRFASVGLSLTGNAAARAIPVPGPQNPIQNVSGNAEFGTTLIWLGIVSAQAFDSPGQVIALPADVAVGPIGSQTGMDYWDAAPRLRHRG